ncbi:hypothetical protein [Sphingobium yanoikuyae]|uniref:hypothetical protein n=1 Tax=Sphingobium yanoikuyae TaxID=13690 RepID=UPI003F026FC1
MTTKPNEPDAPTLRDVEASTIELMRAASQRNGMNLSSWVSTRLREAADRALAETSQPVADAGGVTAADREAYLAMNMLPEFDAADVRSGLWDKVTGVQAFARHRLQSVAAATAGKDAAIRARDDHFRNAQRLADKLVAKDAEIVRLRGGLEAISDLLDGEIKIRWRDGQSNMNESEAAGNSTLYSLLSVPRNIARAALSEAREAGVKD